ncbi:hypothetical protein [Bradyrhizobium sp. SZCCHNRI3052]|uniref:hypothetical protein n=1 Tax=Bradyrhizobium sp. SZCCHNRI3052 TaxID=3057295 RepID=UPI00291660A5|nr:hypothetical protein [Bradyrhizobium sp. SZCCHNRI3052]
MTTAKPPARYGAIWERASGRLCSTELHHLRGHDPPQPIALHPVILRRYEEQLVRLENALGKGVSAGDTEAAEAIRDLVETVTVSR